jgi:hypothetical protein
VVGPNMSAYAARVRKVDILTPVELPRYVRRSGTAVWVAPELILASSIRDPRLQGVIGANAIWPAAIRSNVKVGDALASSFNAAIK